MVFIRPTFSTNKSTIDLGGIAAGDYTRYTYWRSIETKYHFFKNIKVFFNRVGYFFSHGTTISNEKLIRGVITYLDSAANSINNGSLKPETSIHFGKVNKLIVDLIHRVNDPTLKGILVKEYGTKLLAYNEAVHSKKLGHSQSGNDDDQQTQVN